MVKYTIDASPTNFKQMIDKIRAIIKGKYKLSHEEIELEDEVWKNRIVYCWEIDNESPLSEEAKKKMAEYQHEYYVTHRKKQTTKIMDMSDRAVKGRATMSKLRNRMCLYENETVKYGTLIMRLHNKLGFSFHDAKLIADEALIKE